MTTETNAQTPRTDAEAQWAEWNGEAFQCVHATFARELEQELREAVKWRGGLIATPPQEASMNKRITIHCGEELMAHFPSGQVKFLTFIGFIKLAWWAVRNKVEIDIVDGGKRG